MIAADTRGNEDAQALAAYECFGMGKEA